MTFVQKFFQSWSEKKRRSNRVLFNCLAITLLLFATSVYLFQVKAGISHYLEIQEIGEKITFLKIENENLVKKTAELGSMANIAQIVQELKMVKIDQVDYLISSEEILADL